MAVRQRKCSAAVAVALETIERMLIWEQTNRKTDSQTSAKARIRYLEPSAVNTVQNEDEMDNMCLFAGHKIERP